ncbi:hypothetical protein RUM44_012912 [Polyplax serrata]|uniref:Protein inturned n=1 Tax=Polyplax serrata TaxID=468196 RepID=A0ABR1BCN3_POLSC
MEEKELLLYKIPNTQDNSRNRGPHQQNRNDEDDTSSEDSEEWFDESESWCSSCCGHHSQTSCTILSGRILNWMRRRNNKKLQVSKSLQNDVTEHQTDEVLSLEKSNTTEKNREFKEVGLRVVTVGQGTTLCEKLLGVSVRITKEKEIVVTGIISNGPAENSSIAIGDVILGINDYSVTPQNFEGLLKNVNFPSEIKLKIQGSQDSEPFKKVKFQSLIVQSLTKKNEELDTILQDQPVGIVVVDVESQNLNKDDIIYCYPESCTLSKCRGAFVTLHHLLAEIRPNDTCQSSSVVMKKQKTHVLYSADQNLMLLLAIPQAKCTLKESKYIFSDLIRNLLFCHQSLKRCFEARNKLELDHFFSLFFSRILSNGFLSNAFEFKALSQPSLGLFLEPSSPYFEDVLPFATWVPLPKEAQVQIDEALNELESNDFDIEDDDTIQIQKQFNIVGSCLFHKGFLLASHLPKDDLLDIYAYYRQNCLIQLFRSEPVKSLVIWREVYPSSVNRGLLSTKPANFALPSGRWFMLTVGQDHDSLTVLLVASEFCSKVHENAGPSVIYVEEVEDTLRHMQKLGISTLASQWIESNSRFRTTTPEEILAKKKSKKENLLGLVKTFDGPQRTSVTSKVPHLSIKPGDLNQGKRPRSNPPDTSEDSVSQSASNMSELSDENAPILGRRRELGRAVTENVSDDSDSSDSDWDSSKDSNIRESICMSGIDHFYLCDVGEILPARLTTGTEDTLFYYVHVDGAEGVLINPPLNAKRSTPKMKEILDNFRRCSQIIHSILENNINFKKNGQDNSRCFINKSLIAVKEHGVIHECFSSELESGRKPISFQYWIVGRLFFTPQPREIYVCYSEEAPQNLVEIAFRLGLSAAG